MILSIDTKNFETHLDTHIDLHPGVNTFVGESDEGKSGIVRQIKWNSRNRPSGDSYRNNKLNPKKKKDKLKQTEVSIDYAETGAVARARDGFPSGVNHYIIDDGEPLRALRTDVPDEVQEVTKMKDINIQGQHPSEQYFLLADNPGQVAKKLNKVSGLSIMDDVLKSINSQIRACNAEISVCKNTIEEKEDEVEETKWVDKAEKFSLKLERYKNKISPKQTAFTELIALFNHINITDNELKEYDGLRPAKIYLQKLKLQKKDIAEKESTIKTICEVVLSIKSVDLRLKNSVDAESSQSALNALIKQNSDILTKEENLENLKDLIESIKIADADFTLADDYLSKIKKIHAKIYKDQKCPTCGRKGK